MTGGQAPRSSIFSLEGRSGFAVPTAMLENTIVIGKRSASSEMTAVGYGK